MVHFSTLLATAMKCGTKTPVKNYPSVFPNVNINSSKWIEKLMCPKNTNNLGCLWSWTSATTSQPRKCWQNTPVMVKALASKWRIFPITSYYKLQELQIKWKHSTRPYHLIYFYQIKHILSKAAINFLFSFPFLYKVLGKVW